MGVQEPADLLGIHTNMPGVVPPDIDTRSRVTGQPAARRRGLSDEEKAACEQLDFVYQHVCYACMMGSRPQTLTGLADSPVGLAAFMLDHDAASLELISRAFAGQPEGLTRDDVLDNITLFWLTNTASPRLVSTGRTSSPSSPSRASSIPVAVSVFPDELYQAPQELGRAGLPEPRPLQQAPQGRALRGLGAADSSSSKSSAPASGRFASRLPTDRAVSPRNGSGPLRGGPCTYSGRGGRI